MLVVLSTQTVFDTYISNYDAEVFSEPEFLRLCSKLFDKNDVLTLVANERQF